MTITKLYASHVLVLVAFIIQGCSSLPYDNKVNDKVFFYKCLEKTKKEVHFFSNAFVIPPTPERKNNRKALGQREVEESIGVKFEWCVEIPESEVNLSASPKLKQA